MASPLTPGGRAGQAAATPSSGVQANPGLLWTRYLPLWEGTRRQEQVKPALDDFVKAFKEGEKAGIAWLKAHRARRDRALEHLARRSGRTLRLVKVKTSSRFATGLGAAHPIGNGFAFDATSGLPVLPGSALKGLCRRAAALQGLDAATCTRMFGPEQGIARTTAGRGTLGFFDGLLTAWPRLGVEIVNPHHGAYYRGSLPAPTETESPVPAFFLVVEKGATFSIPLLATDPAEADAAADLLHLGLEWLGLGAKTAAGYGLMVEQVERE